MGELKLSPNITGPTVIHLSLAAMCFGVPSIFAREDTLLALNKYSSSIAIVLLVVYFVGMFYAMVNREKKEASQVIHEAIEATAPKWSVAKSLLSLLRQREGSFISPRYWCTRSNRSLQPHTFRPPLWA